MEDFLISNGFTLASVVQIALIVLTGGVIFTMVKADVGYLKQEVSKKANSELVDAQITNINTNIALMQQDLRQIQLDVKKLAQQE